MGTDGYAPGAPRRPVPFRLLLSAAALAAAFGLLSAAFPGSAPPLAMLAAVALFLTFSVVFPPVREALAVDWALAGTASPSAGHRARSVSFLAQCASTLPPFAKDVLPDVLIRATLDRESTVRWQGMVSCARAAPHLSPGRRRPLVEALLAAAARDGEATVRAGAARALVAVLERAPPEGEAHVMDRLPPLVEDPDTGVVASWCAVLPRLARATGDRAPPPLIDALLRLAGSSEPVSRWSARRALVAVGALAAPATRAAVIDYLFEHTKDPTPQARVDALEELMELLPALEPGEAARVRAHLEELGDGGQAAVAGFVLLAWAMAARAGDGASRLPAALAASPAGGPRLVRAARVIAASEAARAAGAAPESLEVNLSAGPLLDAVAEFENGEPLVRRLARASVRAAFPLLTGAARAALIGALLEMHAKPPQPARTNASAALVDVREALGADEVHRVARALADLMASGHESVRRQATVTAVGLMPRATPEASAVLLGALRAMSADPDPVVADQAKDSLTALAEERQPTA